MGPGEAGEVWGRTRFRRLVAGSRFLLVAEPFADSALQLGLLDSGGLGRLLEGARGRGGRGPTALLRLPGRLERLHLRGVRDGGALGRVRGGVLFGLERPISELRATALLAAAGAPVPTPALVAAQRRAGPAWTAAVGTICEEDARDGAAFLASRPARGRLLRAAAAAGEAVRRLHDAGGAHADLHIANLLVRESEAGTRALLVDLDRVRTVAQLSARERMAELMRLHRSLVKRGLLAQVGPRGCARFFASYTEGDRAARRALLAHLPRERLRLAIHRLGYAR